MSDESSDGVGRNGEFTPETFTTSRQLDFCTEKELTAQTGYRRKDWPVYTIHEPFDNALDACEESGTPPELGLFVSEAAVEVRDNGPGIPPETVQRVLDFDSRVSSREVYVWPCRGTRGNALKTLVMMPFVLDGQAGRVEVIARGRHHRIGVRLDRIAQRPEFDFQVSDVPQSPGTIVRLHWPSTAADELVAAGNRMAALAEDYTFFNPHLSVQIDCLGRTTHLVRSRTGWVKWMPNQPPCAHWYETEDLAKHMAACITKDRQAGTPMPETPTAAPPHDGPSLYLDLLKRCLLNLVYPEAEAAFSPGRPPADPRVRLEGRDWPPFAHTMVGWLRLDNLQRCAEATLRDGVPGDFLEAGVWRGGAAILLRGILKAYGVTDRLVWAADSFAGLPPRDPARYPADAGLDLHRCPQLAVPLEAVRLHFARYGLLDDRVRFLKGWFRDTLPAAPVERLALLRLDGDLYESTTDSLTHLYPKLSPGGFVVVDDYGDIAACRQAVTDYRRAHAIDEPIVPVDWTGAYWRRTR